MYGIRQLLKRRILGATPLVIVLILAIGMGAVGTMFSLVHATLLKSLPFPQPERVYVLEELDQRGRTHRTSLPNFRDWERESSTLQAAAAFQRKEAVLSMSEEEKTTVMAAVTTPGLFDVLQGGLLLGRGFKEHDRDVVILSHSLWKSLLGGDRSILGSRLQVTGRSRVVVGVTVPGLTIPPETDLWLLSEAAPDDGNRRALKFHGVIGRLKQGVAIGQARPEFNRIAERLTERFPNANANVGIVLTPLGERLTKQVRGSLLLLVFSAGFVLAIAGCSVGSILFLRALRRRREVALRRALGAGGWDIVKDVLAESIVLNLVAGALGAAFAILGIRLIQAGYPEPFPQLYLAGLNGPTIIFLLAVLIATTLVCGLAPLWESMGGGRVGHLREDTPSPSNRVTRFQRIVVLVQVATSCFLLIGTVLMMRSYLELSRIDPGFEAEGVMMFRLSQPGGVGIELSRLWESSRELAGELERVPGVKRACLMGRAPLQGAGSYDSLSGYSAGGFAVAESETTFVVNSTVGPGFFQVMGIPVLAGRSFDEGDRSKTEPVAIINQEMRRRLFGERSPIGQNLILSELKLGDKLVPALNMKVVGVVADVRQDGLTREVFPQVYRPPSQAQHRFWGARFRFEVGVQFDDDQIVPVGAIRSRIEEKKTLQVDEVRTMDSILSASYALPRFFLALFGIYGVFAVVLTCVASFGLLSYLVRGRTSEIGLRIALGAIPSRIIGMILEHYLVAVLFGIVVGLFGAWSFSHLLEKLLFGVEATDPTTFVLVPVLLVSISLAAAAVPVYRALSIEPSTALRYE